MNGNKSVTYTISMSTDQDNLSPVLDVNRCNLITAATRMDNPKGNEDRFGVISQTLVLPTTSDFTVSTVSPDTVSGQFTVTGVSGGSFINTVDSASRLTQSGSGASAQIVNVNGDVLELIDITGTFVDEISFVSQGAVSATLAGITIKTGIVIGWDSGTGNLKVKVITDDLFSVNDRIDDTNAGTSPVTARLVSGVSKSNGFLLC